MPHPGKTFLQALMCNTQRQGKKSSCWVFLDHANLSFFHPKANDSLHPGSFAPVPEISHTLRWTLQKSGILLVYFYRILIDTNFVQGECKNLNYDLCKALSDA